MGSGKKKQSQAKDKKKNFSVRPGYSDFESSLSFCHFVVNRELRTSDNKILNVKRISKVLLQNDAILKKLQNDVALLIFRLKIAIDIHWMVHFELTRMIWLGCNQVSKEENTKPGGSQPCHWAVYEIGNILNNWNRNGWREYWKSNQTQIKESLWENSKQTQPPQ